MPNLTYIPYPETGLLINPRYPFACLHSRHFQFEAVSVCLTEARDDLFPDAYSSYVDVSDPIERLCTGSTDTENARISSATCDDA